MANGWICWRSGCSVATGAGKNIVRAKTEWAWLYRHACSTARRILQKKEEDEQPFKPGKKVVAVEVKAITKLPAPESYQVLWTETATDKTMPMVKVTRWTGVYSVGRFQPPTL